MVLDWHGGVLTFDGKRGKCMQRLQNGYMATRRHTLFTASMVGECDFIVLPSSGPAHECMMISLFWLGVVVETTKHEERKLRH